METERNMLAGLLPNMASLCNAFDLLAVWFQRASETLEQLSETLKQLEEAPESFIEIENENYTIRFPTRLFPNQRTAFYDCWLQWWAFRNFNPPKRRHIAQDKRENARPLGTAAYLYKAKEMKNLARGTKPHKSNPGMGLIQCKHTFEITKTHCAPCDGYNVECRDYEKHDAADTKRNPKA